MVLGGHSGPSGGQRWVQPGFDESLPSGDNRKVATLQNVGLWRSLGARFHGMEEVVGSIPTRSTNNVKHLAPPPFRDFVASLSQIPKPHHEPAS